MPSAVVLGTEIFDRFLDENNLRAYALASTDDAELTREFIENGIFPEDLLGQLAAFLDLIKAPLAVRSSQDLDLVVDDDLLLAFCLLRKERLLVFQLAQLFDHLVPLGLFGLALLFERLLGLFGLLIFIKDLGQVYVSQLVFLRARHAGKEPQREHHCHHHCH